jgi:lysyl oxidase
VGRLPVIIDAAFRRLAVLLAAGAGLLALQMTSTAPAAGAAGPRPLLPDLVTLKMHSSGLVIVSTPHTTLLRLTNALANRGRGPLEIYPSSKSHNCDGDGNPSNDRDAFQRVFLDANGDHVFQRATDTSSRHRKFGCDRYHARARRWDIFDLARYTLLKLHSGKRVAQRNKVAFCTLDLEHPFPNLPGSPRSGYYPRGNCNETSTLGVSVGWADEYYYSLEGQQLNVTGVKAGNYCLVSKGDPDDLLRESRNANNTRKTRIRLNPAKRRVRTLPGRCELRS